MDWLTQLFGPAAADAASGGFAGVPQQSQTMMYPFNAPQAQDFPAPPEIPQGGVAGGALPTAPAPMAYSQTAATGGASATPSGGASGTKNALLDALRGVKAPAPPEVQKVATPHLTQPRPIQGGNVAALMASLGLGPRDVFQLPKLTRPT